MTQANPAPLPEPGKPKLLDQVRHRCRVRHLALKPKHLPVVYTPEEAMGVIGELNGRRWLMGMQLYGGGLRLNECLRQRVKDVDFERLQVIVRDGKGEKDRVTLLPEAVVKPLKEHLATVRKAHERALAEGYAGVELPYALARKYPSADREWGWQYVYPSERPSRDPRSGAWRRHHSAGSAATLRGSRAYVTTLLASVGRCSRPERIHQEIRCFATTLLASVERCSRRWRQ